ncbi:hypothetical protein LIER_42929 [Lithospermum erythrorhizon]|uniref:Uncharacterized protein n=1 Tax=Lithospermum erythrorhizon TaxID=34254 RepID=A0AAV3P9D3_LITER
MPLLLQGQQNTDATLPDRLVSNPHSESQLGFQTLSEDSNSVKGSVCLSSQSNAQGKMVKEACSAPSVLDVDIEKGLIESPKSNDEAAEHMKMESTFLRAVQREISLQIGGKFMQLLMNKSVDLPKFSPRDKVAGERIYDASINRSRKYKRSASFNSFNSRRIVLLFSVLSIMGTMILIYLTLRVRQVTDAAASA